MPVGFFRVIYLNILLKISFTFLLLINIYLFDDSFFVVV